MKTAHSKNNHWSLCYISNHVKIVAIINKLYGQPSCLNSPMWGNFTVWNSTLGHLVWCCFPLQTPAARSTVEILLPCNLRKQTHPTFYVISIAFYLECITGSHHLVTTIMLISRTWDHCLSSLGFCGLDAVTLTFFTLIRGNKWVGENQLNILFYNTHELYILKMAHLSSLKGYEIT